MSVLVWIGMAAAVGLLLAASAEAGARLWLRWRRRYYVRMPGQRLLLRLERDLVPELEPEARFEVNADGERGDPVPRSTPRLYRVLAAGGSPAEAYALDQATSWPGVLQRLLARPENLGVLGASRVHVGNVGRSGVGAEHLDLIFEKVLPQYGRLDAILVMVGGNDVFHWLERGAPVAFDPPAISPDELFSCHPEGPFGWKPADLALVELLRRARHRWLRRPAIREHVGGWYREARAMRNNAREVRTSVPDPCGMLTHFEHHFRRLLRLARARADRVLVIRQPWFKKDRYTPEELAHFWHGGAGKPWRERVGAYYSCEVLNRLMEQMDARAVQVAEELASAHLNLMPVLEPCLANYYDFVHYTPTGSAIVAAAVAAALLESVPVPERLGREAQAGPAPARVC